MHRECTVMNLVCCNLGIRDQRAVYVRVAYRPTRSSGSETNWSVKRTLPNEVAERWAAAKRSGVSWRVRTSYSRPTQRVPCSSAAYIGYARLVSTSSRSVKASNLRWGRDEPTEF